MKPSINLVLDPPAPIIARPVAYGVCQAGCAALVIACYTAGGATWGATLGATAPATIIGCNIAFGTCSAACIAAGCLPELNGATKKSTGGG